MHASNAKHTPAAVMLRDGLNVERLVEDLERLGADRFRAQRTHDENLQPSEETTLDWKVLSLCGPGGDPDRTDPGRSGVDD